VNEGNLVASGPWPGHVVDEADALGFQAGQCLGKVWYPVGDVVKAGPAAGEETPHGAFGPQRFQEFQRPDELDPDPLAFQDLRGGTCIARQELEYGASLLQGGDSHGDVVKRIREHISVPGWGRSGLVEAPEPGGMVPRAAPLNKE